MIAILGGYWQDEEGLTTIEYAILLMMIVLGTVGAWTSLDSSVNHAVDLVNNDGFGS